MTLSTLHPQQAQGTAMDVFTKLMLRVSNALSLSDDGTMILTKEGDGFSKLTRAYSILADELSAEQRTEMFYFLSDRLNKAHYATLCNVIESRRKAAMMECLSLPIHKSNRVVPAGSAIDFSDFCNYLEHVMR